MNFAPVRGWFVRVWFWPTLILLCLARLWVASRVSLLPDEAYYWVWSRALAPGYFDHPPMVALWIRLGTALLGQTELGVRLLGPVSVLAGSVLIYRCVRDLLPQTGPAGARMAALLMNATLFWGVASLAMTPDIPLLFFWVLSLWTLGRLVATGQGVWWLAVGGAVGCAMVSKYSAALLPIGILLWMAGEQQRHWWRSPWLYLGALLALLLFVPVIGWNATHDWASFARQGGRVADFRPSRAVNYELELILGQFAIATPVVAWLCVRGAWAAWLRRREQVPALLAAMIWPGVILFVEHGLGDRVQANWPAVIYPAAVIAVAMQGTKSVRTWANRGSWLGLCLGAVILAQFAFDLLPLPRNLVALPMRREATQELVRHVAQIAGDAPYIASDNYGMAALLAWYLPDSIDVLALGDRWREFNLPSADPVIRARTGLLLLRAQRRPALAQNWADKALIAQMPSFQGSQGLLLYRVQGVKPGSGWIDGAVMPKRINFAPAAPQN